MFGRCRLVGRWVEPPLLCQNLIRVDSPVADKNYSANVDSYAVWCTSLESRAASRSVPVFLRRAAISNVSRIVRSPFQEGAPGGKCKVRVAW